MRDVFFGVRGGNKRETSTAQYPNTEMKFGEGKKNPSIFSF